MITIKNKKLKRWFNQKNVGERMNEIEIDNYNFTDKVFAFLENCILDEISIGCSDSNVFKVNKDNNIYYLKMAKKGLLKSEYDKLKWLQGRICVPKIVLYDESDDYEYLITESVEGEMVCSDYYQNNQELGLEVIKEAFNNIIDVDISNCPFDVSIEYKLALVENNVMNNLVSDNDLKKETLERFGSAKNLLKFLKDNKFVEEKCFSHGDTSLPNIFANNNKFSGFIDVGECGIADKWFDLAICEKSIKRNYGEEYVSKFYEKLDVIPDRDKIDYYLLMMELYL